MKVVENECFETRTHLRPCMSVLWELAKSETADQKTRPDEDSMPFSYAHSSYTCGETDGAAASPFLSADASRERRGPAETAVVAVVPLEEERTELERANADTRH